MTLCGHCLGRGFVYSPGGYAPKLACPVCDDEDGEFAREGVSIDAEPPLNTPEIQHKDEGL